MNWTLERTGGWPVGASAAVLGAAGTGLALMFLLDPQAGRRRRALAKDRFAHYRHVSGDAWVRTRRDLKKRSRGKRIEAIARAREGEVPDEILGARVRARLGRVCSHPHAIRVAVNDGVVTLTGQILKNEAKRVVRELATVRGVDGVEDRLERHRRDTRAPALQGGRTRERKPEYLQRHWSPAARVVALGAGGVAIGVGLRRGDAAGWALAGAGGLVCARAAFNAPVRTLVGLRAGRRAVPVQKDIRIHAPLEEVFAFFCQLQAFPRVMDHLDRIEVSGARSRWKLHGPGGIPVRWEAQIVEFLQDAKIGWRSIPGSPVPNEGVLRFQPEGDRSTRVEVRMTYTPPGGRLGHGIARLLGQDPRKLMDQDLLRVKSLLETGTATAHHATVSRDEVFPRGRSSRPDGPPAG